MLCTAAQTIQTTLRTVDIVGRCGGEEFLAVLPEKDEEAAERMRVAVASRILPLGVGVHLMCSIGVATLRRHGDQRETLVTAADQAMYAAKQLGRNQVCCAGEATVTALETAQPQSCEETALLGVVEAMVSLVSAQDQYTGDHTETVGHLAEQLAQALGCAWEVVQVVGLSGRLHDIGKIVVPGAILRKPGPLTKEEWRIVHTHLAIGAEVVSYVPALRPLALHIRGHHERGDGQGYPALLAKRPHLDRWHQRMQDI